MKNKEKVRQDIVEVAASVFSRFGYKKTSMDDIASVLGMGKSSLYYYFRSKEEIFEAVVVHEAELLKKSLQEVLNQNKDPRSRLKNYILVRMRELKKLSNYYNAIFSPDFSHFAFIERIRKRYDKEERQTVEKILIEGARLHAFNIENTRLAATAICTAMKGLEIPLFWENKGPETESRLDDILMILFYGIVKR
jgi:AcrR family transcriptional regulator